MFAGVPLAKRDDDDVCCGHGVDLITFAIFNNSAISCSKREQYSATNLECEAGVTASWLLSGWMLQSECQSSDQIRSGQVGSDQIRSAVGSDGTVGARTALTVHCAPLSTVSLHLLVQHTTASLHTSSM